jgi:crotonobetainyl-CoA:carnitine CoA-transferase CaiB-like acyl-CoA transferase
MALALEGIRVLDLSRVLAGPTATQILGDLGADITKIERPESGDDTRAWGPPYLEGSTLESAYYLSANRNKKSVCVDIATPQGQKIIHALLKQSDILVENFKVGSLAKYGLAYEQLKSRYPNLIYCSITGFGREGPLAREPGYDFIAQAMGGMMSATGEPDREPVKAGVAVSDVMSGLYAVIGILAALQSGKGQHVDISLLNVTLAGMTNLAQYYLTSGTPAMRYGNAHSTIVPYQCFKAQDGYIVIAVGNDAQFRKFAQALGAADWSNDERFATNSARVRHRAILVPLIEAALAQKTVGEWTNLFRHIDVPAGPVNTMDQAFAEEQVQAQEMQIDMNGIALVGSPLKLSETPVSYRVPPPRLGQHTDDILAGLGYTEAQIAAFRRDKII